MRQILDANGNVKFYINDLSTETQVLSPQGELLYRYIKATGQTLDKNGNLYMRGNIVLGLR